VKRRGPGLPAAPGPHILRSLFLQGHVRGRCMRATRYTSHPAPYCPLCQRSHSQPRALAPQRNYELPAETAPLAAAIRACGGSSCHEVWQAVRASSAAPYCESPPTAWHGLAGRQLVGASWLGAAGPHLTCLACQRLQEWPRRRPQGRRRPSPGVHALKLARARLVAQPDYPPPQHHPPGKHQTWTTSTAATGCASRTAPPPQTTPPSSRFSRCWTRARQQRPGSSDVRRATS
jgi:hypothetical protein